MANDFELIVKLKFQEAIEINGKVLYRAQECPDLNTKDSTIDYFFYDRWDKTNILPKPAYRIRLYVKIENDKKSDGWIQNRIGKYKKGVIENLKTGEKEIIRSIKNK